MYILIRKNIISNFSCSPKMLFVIKCVVITLELCISCVPDPPSVTREMALVSPLYLNQNELILVGMYVN